MRSAEPEDEIILVCATQSVFLDDLHAACADCATDIVYRPHAPQAVRLCMPCAAVRIRAQQDKQEPVQMMMPTEQTRRELAAWVVFQRLEAEMRRGGKPS
jgi:hypothetical protein